MKKCCQIQIISKIAIINFHIISLLGFFIEKFFLTYLYEKNKDE